MKRLVTWALLAVLLGLAGTGRAAPTRPFVSVSTTPDELDLGTAVFFQGVHEVPGALTVKVDANCWHGPVSISTTPLERYGGGSINPGDIFVRTPAIGKYVSLARPVVILPTAKGSEKVVLDFKVHADMMHPSGSYRGTITLTIVPPV